MVSEIKARAEQRFISAARDLQKVTSKELRSRLGEITFPDFEAINGIGNRAKALREALESLIHARSEVGNQEAKRGLQTSQLVGLERLTLSQAS
jgi:hypothetical protein